MKSNAVVYVAQQEVGKKRSFSAAWLDKDKTSFFINVRGTPSFELVFECGATKKLKEELNK